MYKCTKIKNKNSYYPCTYIYARKVKVSLFKKKIVRTRDFSNDVRDEALVSYLS